MDIDHTPDSRAAEAELNEAIEASPKDVPAEARRDRRQMRMAEYEETVLEHPEPLVASVGALNADLLTMAHQIGPRINQALAEGGATVETVRDLTPVFSTYQNITRQIARFSDFERRATEAEQELESLRVTLKMTASGGSSPAAPPRGLAANRNPWRGAR